MSSQVTQRNFSETNNHSHHSSIRSEKSSKGSIFGRIGSVVNKIDSSVKVLNTAKKVTNNTSAFICGTTATLTGIDNICKGNLLTGAAIAGAGVLQMMNIFMSEQSTGVRQELLDAKSDLEVIIDLAEENKKYFETARTNIKHLKHQITRAESLLRNNSQIATEGRADLKREQARLQGEINDAIATSTDAEKKLKKSTQQVQKAYEQLSRIYQEVGNLAKITAKTPEAQQKLVTKAAEKIQNEIKVAQKRLQLAMETQKEGQELFLNSKLKIENANLNVGKLMGRAEERFKQIEINSSQKISYKDALQSGLEACDKGLLNTKQQLFHGNHAKNRIDRVLGNSFWERIKTVATAAAVYVPMAALGAGTLTTAAAVGAALYTVDNPKIVTAVADKVFGVKETKTEIIRSSKNSAQFKFDGVSSGIKGRYITGGASQTAGNLTIKVGKNDFSCRINFNSKPCAMAPKDLSKLSKLLNTLPREERISLVHELETMKIHRGPNHPVGSIIPSNYFLL